MGYVPPTKEEWMDVDKLGRSLRRQAVAHNIGIAIILLILVTASACILLKPDPMSAEEKVVHNIREMLIQHHRNAQ